MLALCCCWGVPAFAGMTVLVVGALLVLGGPRLRGDDGAGVGALLVVGGSRLRGNDGGAGMTVLTEVQE